MQFNNSGNLRGSQNYKKTSIAFSQFFALNHLNSYETSTLSKKQPPYEQKQQLRDPSKPIFLLNKKSDTVHHSIIMDHLQLSNQLTFQNPFLEGKQAKESVQNPRKGKDEVPSFIRNDLKNLKEESFNRLTFSDKIKPLFPIKRTVSGSGQQNFKDNQNPQKEYQQAKQVFSPIHPKRFTTGPFYSPNINTQIKEFSDQQKQKGTKSDEKSTMSISQKSTKVPQFLKKYSPLNKIKKEPESQKLNSSGSFLALKKVSTQFCTQSEFPSDRKSIGGQIRYSGGGYKNYVQTQSIFSKKKPQGLTSSSFAKTSNTPQNIPIKSQHANFEFGRLSSPSSLLTRKKADSKYSPKKFSLKDFELVDKIGKGAFGDVFVARQKLIGFLCVLKKMSKKKIKQLNLEDSILREIKIQSFLKHKHLTALYGYFDDEEYLYLILQILPDGSMSQVKKKRKIPEMQVSRYLRQVCQGLRYMHKQEVIHRDLKPQNILMNYDYLKLGDFGCAIYTQTLRKTMVGCLAYISPEQLNNESYDQKIDAWSVGILTYELISGKAPFEQNLTKLSNQQLESSILKLAFPENLLMSEECKDFISNLLAVNPNQRMTINESIKHPFIIKSLEQDRKDELQVFGIYQTL